MKRWVQPTTNQPLLIKVVKTEIYEKYIFHIKYGYINKNDKIRNIQINVFKNDKNKKEFTSECSLDLHTNALPLT